jgi:hypothetical protein
MSRIFLSHSSADEFEAVALRQWLADNGWDDVFLDVDPERGLAAGDRWQDALRRAADRCEAVVFVVSPAWAQSKWCLAEFLLAKNLNKLIFGVVLKDVPIGELPTEMTSEWQLCYLVGHGPTKTIHFTHRERTADIELLAEGLSRLRSGLQTAGRARTTFLGRRKGTNRDHRIVASSRSVLRTPRCSSDAMRKSSMVSISFVACARPAMKGCSSSSAPLARASHRSCGPGCCPG